jgi:hypothetical protein
MPAPYPSIRPQLSEAHDPHFNLDSLIDQLCAYISDANTCPHMSPVQKAGVLYLTFVEAYQRCGMTQKEHAPDLLLAHDGKDYEVRYHFLLHRYGETHRHYRRYFPPRVSIQSRAKSVHPSSKLRPPPCTLQRLTAMVSDAGPRHDESTSTLHLGEAVASVETVTPEERPADASSSDWVKRCLERLDHLEDAQVNLSTAVNWAYYRLGEAGYDFWCVRIGLC